MVNFLSTQADTSQISDTELKKSREVITENNQRGTKWSLIAQMAMWSMFFILSGATAEIIRSAEGIPAMMAVAAAVAVTGTIGVVAGLISNKIGTSNSFNQSEYNARTIAKEIEKLGDDKEKMTNVTITAATPLNGVSSSSLTGTNAASPHIHTKGLEYLHALMEAPAASQKIN